MEAPKYRSLKDHVYDYIAQKIQDGTLLPNQKINEAEICKKLDISRTPTREALFQLTSDNLLQYIPRRGFIVAPFDAGKNSSSHRPSVRLRRSLLHLQRTISNRLNSWRWRPLLHGWMKISPSSIWLPTAKININFIICTSRAAATPLSSRC